MVGKGKWKFLELLIPPVQPRESRKKKGREGERQRERKRKNKEKSIMGKVGEMAEIIAILEYQE